MRIHLAGHLAWYDASRRSHVEIPLDAPTPLPALIQQLRVPAAEIAVATLNGNPVPLDDTLVTDQDLLDLYPPVGGGA